MNIHEVRSTPTDELDWSKLIFGSYSHEEIALAVRTSTWQSLRVSILSRPLRTKYEALVEYATELDKVTSPILHSPEQWEERKHRRKVAVTNYVNALKRGGLIP